MRARRAFMTVDTTLGLMLLGVLATVLSVSMASQRRASAAMALSRDAVRTAQRALTAMQSGGAAVAVDGQTQVRVRRLAGGAEVPGYDWVEVTVRREGHRAVVSALVKHDAPAGAR